MASNGPGRPKKEVPNLDPTKVNHEKVFTFPMIAPRSYQLPAWKAFHNGIRTFFISMPRRAGKDILSTSMAVDYAMEHSNVSVVLMAPNKAYAKRIWWKKGQKGIRAKDMVTGKNRNLEGSLIDICLPNEFRESTNKTDGVITLNNGSTITVMGSDDEGFVGMKINFVVISETAKHNKNIFPLLDPVIRESKGCVIYNGTQEDDMNHFWQMMNNARKIDTCHVTYLTSEDTKQYCWVSDDGAFNINPELLGKVNPEDPDGDLYDNIDDKRKLGFSLSYLIREYTNVPTSVEEGSYYTELLMYARKEERIGPMFGYDPMFPTYCALDLGISDHTAIIWYQVIENDIFFIDYYEETGQEIKHFIDVIRSKSYNTKAAFAPHDSSKRSLATGLNIIDWCKQEYQFQFSYVPKSASIMSDINVIRGYFPRMHFAEPNCKLFISNLNKYREKVTTHKPLHGPESHAADAFRYAIMTVHRSLLKATEFTSMELGDTPARMMDNVNDSKSLKDQQRDAAMLKEVMGSDQNIGDGQWM